MPHVGRFHSDFSPLGAVSFTSFALGANLYLDVSRSRIISSSTNLLSLRVLAALSQRRDRVLFVENGTLFADRLVQRPHSRLVCGEAVLRQPGAVLARALSSPPTRRKRRVRTTAVRDRICVQRFLLFFFRFLRLTITFFSSFPWSACSTRQRDIPATGFSSAGRSRTAPVANRCGTFSASPSNRSTDLH